MRTTYRLILCLALSAAAACTQPVAGDGSPPDDPATSEPDGKSDSITSNKEYSLEWGTPQAIPLPLHSAITMSGTITATLPDGDFWQSSLQSLRFKSNYFVLRPVTDVRQDVTIEIDEFSWIDLDERAEFQLGLRAPGGEVRWVTWEDGSEGNANKWFRSVVLSPHSGRIEFTGYRVSVLRSGTIYVDIDLAAGDEWVIFPVMYSDAGDIQGDYDFELTVTPATACTGPGC